MANGEEPTFLDWKKNTSQTKEEMSDIDTDAASETESDGNVNRLDRKVELCDSILKSVKVFDRYTMILYFLPLLFLAAE
jgi:hypothetical protein